MSKNDQTFLTITEVSRITGYCVSHLRKMVDQDVVSPARTNTGVRLFTPEDVGRLRARRERVTKLGRVQTKWTLKRASITFPLKRRSRDSAFRFACWTSSAIVCRGTGISSKRIAATRWKR
jgi:hypothetical protein